MGDRNLIYLFAADSVAALYGFVWTGGGDVFIILVGFYGLFMLALWRRPIDCLRGACGCRSAANCAFARCRNCDAPLDAEGVAFDDGRWYEEFQRCPDCNGGLSA